MFISPQSNQFSEGKTQTSLTPIFKYQYPAQSWACSWLKKKCLLNKLTNKWMNICSKHLGSEIKQCLAYRRCLISVYKRMNEWRNEWVNKWCGIIHAEFERTNFYMNPFLLGKLFWYSSMPEKVILLWGETQIWKEGRFHFGEIKLEKAIFKKGNEAF